MANLNDVANKREKKETADPIVAKSYHLQQAVGMRRYGSLININLSGLANPKVHKWMVKQNV